MDRRRSLHAAACAAGLAAAGLPAAGLARTLNGFDLRDALVPPQAIEAGGPPRDGIPAIDEPRFVEAAHAGLTDRDRVLGLALGADARAYPVRILNWHEVVNDRVDGQPVAITYCPLCGTGMAFDARIDGQATRFGVSGLLYNSDVLLFDRRTESLWSQIVRDYGRDPYEGYERVQLLMFEVAHRDDRLPPKAWVLGPVLDGRAKAYPFDWLDRRADRDGWWQEQPGDRTLRIRYDRQARSAEAFDADGRALASVSALRFAWVAFHPDTTLAQGG